MGWESALDDYNEWTREMEWRERALAHARAQRAKAVRRMRAGGLKRGRIAWLLGISPERVTQLLKR